MSGEERKILRTTTVNHQGAHEFALAGVGSSEWETTLLYLIEVTSEVETGERALFVCGQIREVAAMKLNELAHKVADPNRGLLTEEIKRARETVDELRRLRDRVKTA